MVAPAVALGVIMVLSSLVSAGFDIYSTNETKKASDRALDFSNAFYSGAWVENDRFWKNYIHKHHLEGRQILYPYRSGFNYDANRLYNAQSNLVANDYARMRSVVGGATHVINSGAYGYGVATRKQYGFASHDIGYMYG